MTSCFFLRASASIAVIRGPASTTKGSTLARWSALRFKAMVAFSRPNALSRKSRPAAMPSFALKLLRHRGVQLLHRATHVLARFLKRVEFLLLLGREHGTDLRHCFVDDRVRLFHRVFVNGDDLRPRLIEQRLDLRLLIGSEIQRLGQMPHRKSLAMPATVASAKFALGFSKSVAGERERADGSECKQVSFHICFHLIDSHCSYFVTAPPPRRFHLILSASTHGITN